MWDEDWSERKNVVVRYTDVEELNPQIIIARNIDKRNNKKGVQIASKEQIENIVKSANNMTYPDLKLEIKSDGCDIYNAKEGIKRICYVVEYANEGKDVITYYVDLKSGGILNVRKYNDE